MPETKKIPIAPTFSVRAATFLKIIRNERFIDSRIFVVTDTNKDETSHLFTD